MFKLNYNFVRDVPKKITLDPNLLQVNYRFWMIVTGEGTKGSQGMRWQNGSRKLIENKNTEDGVIFKGEGM